jgi:hypothetical protein
MLLGHSWKTMREMNFHIEFLLPLFPHYVGQSIHYDAHFIKYLP